MRAYELYVLRGNESGSEMDDWLQAEEEIQDAEEQTKPSANRSMDLPTRCRSCTLASAQVITPGRNAFGLVHVEGQ